MKFNIVSNIDNGVGLQKDSELLKSLLESWGHTASLIHYAKKNKIEEAQGADVNIFLEVVSYDLIARKIARENWLIPNPEWFAPWDHRAGLRQFDQILCKTPDAVRIFKALAENQPSVKYIGFESQDLYDRSIPRERKFLHVAGQSRYKNTMSTVYAFAKMSLDDGPPPELTVIGAYPEEYAFAEGCKNIKTYKHVTDEEMKQMMNSHTFHIMAAGYEGWGHALNEGLGVGAVMMTTDHPPMNEFEGVARDLLIPYQDTIVELSAMRARVVAVPVWDSVKRALRMKQEDIMNISEKARGSFLAQREFFRATFKTLVEDL